MHQTFQFNAIWYETVVGNWLFSEKKYYLKNLFQSFSNQQTETVSRWGVLPALHNPPPSCFWWPRMGYLYLKAQKHSHSASWFTKWSSFMLIRLLLSSLVANKCVFPRSRNWINERRKTLTVSVSHHQHSVVDHPGVAEDLQRVRHTLPVELQEVKRQLKWIKYGGMLIIKF